MGVLDRIKDWWNGEQRISEAPATGRGGSGRDPLATIVRRIGLALDVGTSREYQAPEFDLTQITTAYDTEAYVRQAIDKYIELMFKAGWDITGSNEQAVEYIQARLDLMAEMTQTPIDQLFIEIAEDLVKYSNALVVKARDKGNMLGQAGNGLNVQGLGGQPPVAGYFPINVTTVTVLRDKFGTVKSWEQEVEGGDRPVRYKATDVVHIYYKKQKGRAFGTPFLLSVLDDIRALRQAEETVLRLIYRNLNPLLHIQVGNEDIPGQTPEVDSVRAEFENMDLEAGFVTSERVKISAISADKIIDAKEYLKYFEQRVFTGLGVSELMMGRGNTANRSTGDNLSGEFIDRVKAFQKVMAIFVDEFIIKELLMEGGFDAILNPDDDVNFIFKEIDVDAKIKMENHAIYQYEHNAITEDEMRALLGREPITDRAMMYMELVTIPVAQGTAAAKAAASPTAGTPAANNKNRPTNQHGTRTAPKKKTEKTDYQMKLLDSVDHVFESSHSAVTKLVELYLQTGKDQHLKELSNVVRVTEEDIFHVLQHHIGEYASPYATSIHRVCHRLHEEVIDTVKEMNSSQKDARIFETIGGIYHVLQMSLSDIAVNAYESYMSLKEVD